MTQVRVLAALAEKGLLSSGTCLELVPAALPADAASRDSRIFRAVVGDPRSPIRSIRWEFDGQLYSPTRLTCLLWVEYGVASLGPSYYCHWRVVGRERSLWDEWRSLAE
jgi:hypothetical protein